MNFIERILTNLAESPGKRFVIEMHGPMPRSTSGEALSALIGRARGTLQHHGLASGERAVLLAPNSACWIAADLALLAEGAIVVPMYSRQEPTELVEMMHDCRPALVVCATAALAESITALWSEAPVLLFDALFSGELVDEPPVDRADDDDVTIIYTSGSTGVPKGVVTTVANTNFMLRTTSRALTEMMGNEETRRRGSPPRTVSVEPDSDRVFHYLPFCFAGSRIVLWTCLYRDNGLMISTDLDQLQTELGAAAPNYFLNVPVLLERIKNGVEAGVRDKPAPIQALYRRACEAYARKATGTATLLDRLVLRAARRFVFAPIRQRIGPNLTCLICGSAPLGPDTQRWFEMLGLPVYQVYGLTETTAIVTMDTPLGRVVPGRVGPAIDGVEVRLGEGEELQIRGPNIFARYWEKEAETQAAFTEDGWFRSGDRGEVDGFGNWRIIGRLKNLLVPSSGHNVAPEPIEQKLLETIEGVEQVLLVGHGRPWLAAIVTGTEDAERVQQGIDLVNADLPHYRRVRKFHLADEPFSIENGLLTANQKIRRDAIETAYAAQIEELYA